MLTGSTLVMIWRTVSDLSSAERFATELLEWPKIGSDSYSVLYDAGNIMVGFWEQEKLLNLTRTSRSTLVATALSGERACGQLSLSRYVLVANPACELQFTTNLSRLTTAFGWPAAVPASQPDRAFVDKDGNYFSVSNSGSANNHVTAYNLMVSDLDVSVKFYSDVLGLVTDSSRAFICGKVAIGLREETAIGLVKSLNRVQRLMGDWAVFHVTDIETTAARLENRGVSFPHGIEDSRFGRVAYFNDPDGHSLNLWEPPSEPAEINYFPVLTRLINSRKRSKL